MSTTGSRPTTTTAAGATMLVQKGTEFEPEEEQRMGVVRVQRAKVAGLEGRMRALDLVELVDGQLQN